MAIKKLMEYYTTRAYFLYQKSFELSLLAAIIMSHWITSSKLTKDKN